MRTGGSVYLALYDEVPGCMTEGPTREAAIAELEAFIVPFLQDVERSGGKVPGPMAERRARVLTHTMTISGMVAGDPADLLGAGGAFSEATSSLATKVGAEERELTAA